MLGSAGKLLPVPIGIFYQRGGSPGHRGDTGGDSEPGAVRDSSNKVPDGARGWMDFSPCIPRALPRL